MTNVKALQMNIAMSQKYNFGIALAMLTFIWVKSQIQHVFRLLTNENIENIIFMSKIATYWLHNCAPIQFLLLGIACGIIFDEVL